MGGAEGSGFGIRDAASIGVGALPVAGSVQSVVELISGKDYITGENTSRAMAAVGILAGLIPGGKGALKAGSKWFGSRKAVDAGGAGKPSLSAHKEALEKVHQEVGKLPKGKPGKFGSPQAGDSKKGYRLDPPHDGVAKGDPESKYHINWWDYTEGKRGKGGRSGAISIEE